jgi:hydrogenase maturation factor
VDPQTEFARCTDAAGAEAEVETALVDALSPGDRVLVHAGVAIATLAPEAVG